MYFVNLLRKPIFLKVPVTFIDSYTANANSRILFQKPLIFFTFLLKSVHLVPIALDSPENVNWHGVGKIMRFKYN